jgi:hypothetical protein
MGCFAPSEILTTHEAHCVRAAQSLHPAAIAGDCLKGWPMRAEVQTIVDEIKQSIGLLRRHL